MPKCEICEKEFKYPCELLRHFNRKTKCIKKENCVEKEKIKNEILDETRLQIKNSKDNNLDIKCCYCAKEFTRPHSKKEHEQICKLKNEPAIQLEIQLGIPIGEYKHSVCKFCDKDLKTRSNYLVHIKTCKTKLRYEKNLMARRNENQSNNIINNTTILNDNKRIIVLNNFHNTERCLRKEPDKVIDWIHQDEKQYPNNVLKWKTPIKMIMETHAKPENNNIRINSLRSKHCEIYNDNEWIDVPINDILKEIRSTNSIKIYNLT